MATARTLTQIASANLASHGHDRNQQPRPSRPSTTQYKLATSRSTIARSQSAEAAHNKLAGTTSIDTTLPRAAGRIKTSSPDWDGADADTTLRRRGRHR
jgi:hypothetical protein